MDRHKIRIILQALPLLVPLNIYMIGDGLAAGLQWAFFRYQLPFAYADAPPFFITLFRELGYVSMGVLSGRSAVAVFVWLSGALVLVACLALVLLCSAGDQGSCRPVRYVPHLTILSSFLFLAGCMLQYGISLHGVAGFAIPFGIPVILVIGYWTYRIDNAVLPADEPEPPAEGN